MMHKTRSAEGHITVVQEERFRLVTASGQTLLLTLAHDAHIPDGGITDLHNRNTEVIVEYSGEPNLASGVAHSVRPA